MRLSELLQSAKDCYGLEVECTASPDMAITHITQDSRQVKTGSVFAAIRGAQSNGEDYIKQAIKQGASLILCRDAVASTIAAPTISTGNPRRALSQLAASLHQPQPEHIIAVTGTDGKTSTAEFIRQFWELLGHKAMSVGTLGLKSDTPLQHMPALSENTTPEPVTFYEAIASAKTQGINHLVCEASSHGIEQSRLDGLIPNTAIFTSFSQDHLDYHATMEEYFQAKAALFERLLETNGTAILCSDYQDILALANTLRTTTHPVITYGKTGDLTIKHITPNTSGQHIILTYQGTEYQIELPIFGEFQVYNVVAAMLAISQVNDIDFASMIPLCKQLHTIKGRLECVGKTTNDALIFVDYAHTAGALEKALETLRPYASNQLHLVFGCGGDRDKAKRAQMGSVAATHADHAIITDDNPRTEDAATIRATIKAACPDALEIGDRQNAIYAAISRLSQGDALLIAGKGHEDYQIIGTTKHHFDDAEIVRDALKEQSHAV